LSGPFIGKISLFVVVGVLSIYPTLKFLGWRAPLRAQRVPTLDAAVCRKIRMMSHIELTLLFVIMLLATMMARGIGFLG
jgi:putative membrane protein